MDWSGAATLITAMVAALSFLGGGALGAWKWAQKIARDTVLADQTRETIAAKDAEITELKAENSRLWSLLDELTSPQGRS